jgi:L,D-peptidoglycan transpeptidase YkuD (ErfK/YbiS/YcfS/YnhG family)
MIKSFLITLSFPIFLLGSQQTILVVANDFNSSTATLTCYEDNIAVFQPIKVNLGRNGLAWGSSKYLIPHKSKEPLKYEGDGKAPAGIFKLTSLFGYEKNSTTKMPYIFASQNLICVDDSTHKNYNKIVPMEGDEKSFEFMRRRDDLYKIGVVVAHNTQQMPQRGSCIFLHLQRGEDEPTAGCTSMEYDQLLKIFHWLDPNKNPLLIQLPKEYLFAIPKKLLKTTPLKQ